LRCGTILRRMNIIIMDCKKNILKIRYLKNLLNLK